MEGFKKKTQNVLFLFIDKLFFNVLKHWNSLVVKTVESACSAGDPGSIPGWGRPLGEENGYALQCSCLENPTDQGAWRVTAHRVAKSWTQLHFHFKTSPLSFSLVSVARHAAVHGGHKEWDMTERLN